MGGGTQYGDGDAESPGWDGVCGVGEHWDFWNGHRPAVVIPPTVAAGAGVFPDAFDRLGDWFKSHDEVINSAVLSGRVRERSRRTDYLR